MVSLTEADLDDESTLAEVIALMAPPPEPQKRPKRRITDKHKKIKKIWKLKKECERYELKIDYVAMDQVCTWSHY